MHGSMDWLSWLCILVYWKWICLLSGCFLMIIGGALFLIREYRMEQRKEKKQEHEHL